MRLNQAFIFVTLLLAFACSKDRDAREWKPQDHAHAEPAALTGAASPTSDPVASNDVYLSTCAPCHGATGKGDGPMGRALRVADLSSVAWQDRVTDSDVAKVIREGRGKMPGFDMPPDRIDALVKRVRSLRE